MHVGVLGPLDVRADGEPVEVPGARVRRLLIRLAVDAGAAVSADELVDAVWPDDPPAHAANALQALVSRARKALGDSATVASAGSGYRLAAAPEDVDVHRFATLADLGRQQLRSGRPAEARELLDEALSLWRGDPLAEAGDAEYAAPLIVRWQETKLQALTDRTAAAIELGDGAGQVVRLHELIAAHPLRGDLTELLMQALHATGRTPEALAAYASHRMLLADELGTDPATALQQLHLELLRADPQPTSRRSNLPTALTKFVGRSDEVARLEKLLAEARLVTIVGPGGAGKTRLATELILRETAACDTKTWFVDLAPVTEMTGVVQAFGGVMGVLDRHIIDIPGERAVVDPLERLADSLRQSDAILLVDNCEQVLEAAAGVIEHLLHTCPRLKVLATSREPLGIAGEGLSVLAPLPLPAQGSTAADAMRQPAVQLFVERAQDASADFTLDEGSLDSVVAIVRTLDGLPLALELAAARLRVLPLAEVERRLSDRFALLTGGSRTAMPRHQTLHAVVAWSWDLLTDAERLLLERLAVFPSGASAESAAAVCSDDVVVRRQVPALLDALVDKSLLKVTYDGQLRYRMLDTIRAYGLEQLAERDEDRRARRAHAEYFSSLVEQLEPVLRAADQLDALAVLRTERDNVIGALRSYADDNAADAAVRLTFNLVWYWTMLGEHVEATYWCRVALDVPGDPDPRRAAVLAGVMTITSLAGEDESSPDWDAVQARMRDISRDLERFEYDEPPVLVLRPMIAYFAGDLERAAELLAVALRTDDPWVCAASHTFSAAMAENAGDLATLRSELDAAVGYLEQVADRWLRGSALATRARLLMLDGDLDGATADYQSAAASLADIGSPDDVAFAFLRLAEIALRRGDTAAARAYVDQLDESASTWRPGLMFRTAMLLGLARVDGDVEAGDVLHAQLVDEIGGLADLGAMQGHARAVLMAASASYDIWRGRQDQVAAELQSAFAAGIGTRDMPIIAVVGVATADLAAALGEHRDAVRRLAASAAVRGADDPTDLEVTRLTRLLTESLGEREFREVYDNTRELGREEALLLLDPAPLRDVGTTG